MAIVDLQPAAKHHVFDLVEAAGFDTSDWIASSNDGRGVKANPKYCYEWSFVEPGKVVILNLWYASMQEANGEIFQRNNFRKDAARNAGKAAWVRRATRLDAALQTALRENLSVRVIVNDGIMRRKEDPSSKPSKVTARELDSELWTITDYNWETGDNVITRGVLRRSFVDQFEIEQAEKVAPERRQINGSAFVRDPAVRHAALSRSNGYCELCGERGFEMHTGAIYLETHHIVPLGEGGPDHVHNVAALCPNDHMKAHFGRERAAIRSELLAKLSA